MAHPFSRAREFCFVGGVDFAEFFVLDGGFFDDFRGACPKGGENLIGEGEKADIMALAQRFHGESVVMGELGIAGDMLGGAGGFYDRLP